MSEETERVSTGPEGNGAGIDPTAVALALAGASREKADAFLDRQNILAETQTSFIHLQKHHLHEEIKHLHLDMWEKRLGVWLRAATFCVGIAFVGAIGTLVWNASRSSGLLLEPFSVPPELNGRGLSGEVIAAKLLDDLVAFEAQTSSQRAPRTYANSWDAKAIKLDIPETGVSLAELDQYLREKLGHDIRVSGEIVRTASGLALTVRTGTDGADSVTGQESEIDALVGKLAESVYRRTQTYRYGIYLVRHGRDSEGLPIFQQMVASGQVQDRAWGYIGFQDIADDDDERIRLLRIAVALAPNFALGWENLAMHMDLRSRPETAILAEKKVLSLLSESDHAMIRSDAVPFVRESEQSAIDSQLGAFRDAAREAVEVVQNQGGRLGSSAPTAGSVALAEVRAHDIGAARTTLTNAGPQFGIEREFVTLFDIRARVWLALSVQDWAEARRQVDAAAALARNYTAFRPVMAAQITPLVAYALARQGDFAAAEANIAPTEAECDLCLRTRARIADLRGQHGRADWWFARAVDDAPSIPFAYSEWGEALLARGDANGAITKFRIANQKGPHFADPLEGWGEALMAKNQSHLALAKFAEADKYAPNWGRLHLKWGEALVYAGKREDAKAQFARAAALDLTPSEKAELARAPHG